MTRLSKVLENEQMNRISEEFKRLGERCYLDNAGAALYPDTLLKLFYDDLTSNLYMNPHSDKYTNDCVDQIRTTILNHFNTDSTKYSVVFTSGTTKSLKLIVEAFKFRTNETENCNGSLIYLQDNHTSALGLRELAREKQADILHISHGEFLGALLTNNVTYVDNKNKGNTLFVYPAQSNFNGFKYPINSIEQIKNGCMDEFTLENYSKTYCNWYVLLDAASYVSTSKLDLSITHPDYVCLSFYKIFGFPTGLGALLIKKESENVLSDKKYFGGGTVDIVSSTENFHVKRKDIVRRFEDGTIPFLSIIALQHCFNLWHKLIPKVIDNDIMKTISFHTFYLAKDLYIQLSELKHPNGKKAVVLYNDTEFDDFNKQGGIISFNLKRADGTFIGYAEFQHMADLFNLNIRTGCFCNSGSCQRHLGLTNAQAKEMYKAGHVCGDTVDLLYGKPTGCVRVSFGYYNTYKDVDRIIEMICECFVKSKVTVPERKRIVFEDVVDLNNITTKVVTKFKETHNGSNGTNGMVPINKELDTGILSEIAIFPIKSCGAFKIDSAWQITDKGFLYDREWMIIKDNGVCLTQKNNTRMCMISPKIDIEKQLLILNFKGMDSISIDLHMESNEHKSIDICQSKVCMDTVKAYDCGDEISDWISEALEVSFLRLVRQSTDDKRQQKNKNKDTAKLLSLSNQAQYLLINKATVRWLKEKIQDDSFTQSLDNLTDRFRGNLIVDTSKELIEREWDKVIIGKHVFKVEGMCSRCQMVCIDQHTGAKTVEPLRTISEQFNGKMRFGIYLSHVGTVDGSKDFMLKSNSVIKTVNA